MAMSFLFCLAYGGSDEFHQYFTPNRSCEWLDFLADAIGVVAVHGWFILNFSRKGMLTNV